MVFPDSYFSVARNATAQSMDKGSRFIGYAFFCTSHEEVNEHLREVGGEHPSASHVCFAWRLGENDYRSSDAGEPSGTAGRPILDRIKSAGLTNVLVVVVRYFGGTMLGAPGLMRAYRHAAAQVLEAAGKEEKHTICECSLHCSNEQYNHIMSSLKRHGAKIVSADYDQAHHLVFRIRKRILEDFAGSVKHLKSVKFTINQHLHHE